MGIKTLRVLVPHSVICAVKSQAGKKMEWLHPVFVEVVEGVFTVHITHSWRCGSQWGGYQGTIKDMPVMQDWRGVF